MILFDIGDLVYFDESPQAEGFPGKVHVGRVMAVTGDRVFLATHSRYHGLFPVTSKQILEVLNSKNITRPISYKILDKME